MSAGYTYNADNSVATITYGNGAAVTYSYDDAGRVTGISHSAGGTILQLGYSYSADGLITQITELDGVNPASVTTYEYDNRNRLVEEERTGGMGVPPVNYHLEYTYDQGGNRTTKVDAVNHRRTVYHYDTDTEPIDINGDGWLDDPRTYYGSLNNRLMWYDVS